LPHIFSKNTVMHAKLAQIYFQLRLLGVRGWCWVGIVFFLLSNQMATPYHATSRQGVGFSFRGQTYHLAHPMRLSPRVLFQRGGLTNSQLDTASHCYHVAQHYAELVRQDDPTAPRVGLALGFEFDPTQGEFPYTPARAVVQLKDFRWGGIEFGINDTLNFTGVSDEVSDDLLVEIDGYERDTIFGRFSGLLLNGAGSMAAIDSGWFRVRVYRR
jgi:hypothetical protein